ncbi:MAG: polysaccharide pyruvyl transferase family protein [Prosthecobacter sp.]
MKIAFVGASGYGNVGDDTYPLVFAQQLPGHELVIYNSDLPAHLPEDLGLLVLGGGGILYNNPKEGPEDAESPHFRCMKFYMDAAIARGIPWGMLSCGFQFRSKREDAYAIALRPWVPYLRQAHFITVRSPNCQRIARELGGREDVSFFPDAAYLYDAQVQAQAGTASPTVVTLVPAGMINPINVLVQHYMRQFAASGVPTAWLSMGAPVDDNHHLEEAARCFPESEIIARPGPQEAFRRIAGSRFVLTGRYHGMVFARASGVPFITAQHTPYKITQEDYSPPISMAAGHFEVLRQFTAR